MFGTIDVKVRPLKLAFLVSPRNASQVRTAIRLCTSLWGGEYFPIIPLYKRMPATWTELRRRPKAEDVIRGYLDAFDPDLLVDLAPDIPDYITKLRIERITPSQIWRPLTDERSTAPEYGIGVFELLQDIFEKHFRYTPRYPIRVRIPQIPQKFSLFWTSVFGQYPEDVAKVLKSGFHEPLGVEVVPVKPDTWTELMSGDVLFPRRITKHGIDHHRRSLIRGDASIYFLDATKTEDIVDFWNQRATGRTVMPLPKQLKDSPLFRKQVVRFLRAHRRPWSHNPTVCDVASFIRSHNCTMEEMGDYARSLQIERPPNDPSQDGFFVLQHWYPRIWDEWARDKDAANAADLYVENDGSSIEMTETDKLSFAYKPVLPKFASRAGVGRARCANELNLRVYGTRDLLAEVLPKPTGDNLERTIAGRLGWRDDWRAGKNGLVKIVKWAHPEERAVLTGEEVMFAWLKDQGWSGALSSPGILAVQLLRRLDGYPQTLKNEKLLGLLEYMNGGRVHRDGGPVERNVVTQERQLAVGEVSGRLKEANGHRGAFDFLLEKEVFKLGAVVACPQCMRRSWFSLESLKDSLSCPRCLTTFRASGNVERSKWSYKTTGPFSVANYADGAYGVLIALSFFDDHTLNTLRTTRVASFVAEGAGKKKLEADFAVLWSEALYGEKKDGIAFGECKTYGTFERVDFERMRHIAKTFPGALIVFATLRKTLTRKEMRAISKIAMAGRRYWKAERPVNPVLVLTGNELLSFRGPPYCWEEAHGKKFDHIHGLLAVCDASQQIYLGLPSWHTTWRERWDRNAARRRRRNEMSPPPASPDIGDDR